MSVDSPVESQDCIYARVAELMADFDATDRVFQAHYGVCKSTAEVLFTVASGADESVKLFHVLWMLYFLKTYNTLDVCASHFRVCARTFQHHLWLVIHLLARTLKTVSALWKLVSQPFAAR